ncbi:transmembrane and coiled-coil domains protein 1 [Nephila pilipes]|uniref:Transmembrane and coiled-coil domains protein 1 n=1 Tax=Nephila pilipes TaxID=299642 RepID=A0A8X6P567_NEPPI|nr:transmembrane and coiled-coil domains protein 1 [Nephila pilipes]
MRRKSPVIHRKSGTMSNENNTPKHLTPQPSSTLQVLSPHYGASGANTPSGSVYLTYWPVASSSTEEQNITDEATHLVRVYKIFFFHS